MSSKEQFKDALKRDKRTIIELAKEIDVKNQIIKEQENQLKHFRLLLQFKNKKWWQFWK